MATEHLNEIEDYYLPQDYSERLYHGTSTAFGLEVGDDILPPYQTGELREDWRATYQDKVFSTPSMKSAIKYSRKAVERYGGEPVVFLVEPDAYSWEIRHNAEVTSDCSTIIDVVDNF